MEECKLATERKAVGAGWKMDKMILEDWKRWKQACGLPLEGFSAERW